MITQQIPIMAEMAYSYIMYQKSKIKVKYPSKEYKL